MNKKNWKMIISEFSAKNLFYKYTKYAKNKALLIYKRLDYCILKLIKKCDQKINKDIYYLYTMKAFGIHLHGKNFFIFRYL